MRKIVELVEHMILNYPKATIVMLIIMGVLITMGVIYLWLQTFP